MTNQEQQYLIALGDTNGGRLTADAVVDAARNPDSPIHNRFTWDDNEAANKQRLHEARSLIRSVKVEIRVSKMKLSAPYYVRDPERESKEQGYIATPVLRTEEDSARDAVVAAFKRASRVLQGAREVAAVLGFAEEIDGLISQIDQISRVSIGANATPMASA